MAVKCQARILVLTKYVCSLIVFSIGVNPSGADEVTMATNDTTTTTTTTTTKLTPFHGRSLWLIRNTSGVTWYEASRYCSRQYGGRLAIVDEVSKIGHVVNELASLQKSIKATWLGAKTDESLDQWRTVNGSEIPKGQGLFEESNEDGNCLAMTSRLKPIFCSTKVGAYLCKFSSTSNLDKCNASAESCLVLFNASDFDWFEARRECLKSGGDLASVMNPGQLTERYPYLRNHFIIIGGYRRPWWWMKDSTLGMKEVIYYNWTEGKESYKENSCLTMTSSGWIPIGCNDTTTYFICEGTESQKSTTAKMSTQSDQDLSRGPDVIYIITGCLAGGLVLLIIIVVILVICLRRARKKNESREFEFHCQPMTVSSSVPISVTDNHPVASLSPPSSLMNSSATEYAHAPVDKPIPDPHGILNYSFQETERVNPYAASRIESIIERERLDGCPDEAAAAVACHRDQKPKGTALDGLKKRLSLLLKRDYDESRDALPSAATTLQRSPDVVPMTSFGPNGPDGDAAGGRNGPSTGDHSYAEVIPAGRGKSSIIGLT